MTTLSELTTPLTTAQARAAIYAAIEARGASTTSWKQGSVVRTVIAGLAIVVSAFSRLQAEIAKSGFLDLAEGDWLALVALNVYRVEKLKGSFASGFVTLSNAGGGVYSGGVGDLIFTAGPGRTYRSTAAYSLAGGPGTTAIVAVEAVEIGTASNASATEINLLVTSLPGVTCSNAAALVGANPETDLELRERCNAKTGLASPNGNADAYSYSAKSATRINGTAIGVTRTKTQADGAGGVTLTIANASGAVTGTVGDPTTDLGAVKAAVQRVVPLGVTLTLENAAPVSVPVTYSLWVRGAGDPVQIETEVSARLLALFATLPIGGDVIAAPPGFVYKSLIEATIGDVVAPAELVRLVVTAPAADVVITAGQVPVAGAFVGTITVIQ